MTSKFDPVVASYDREGLEETVLGAFEREFGDLAALGPDDLAPVDEFHIRGRAATEELAAAVGELADREVLDVGSGIGGTARYLAHNHGCRVTGIDLTPRYVALANRLSELVGIEAWTSFREASALALPFPDGAFDVVWMEHIQMNISAKEQLAAELARVLGPHGRLAIHEIFAVEGAGPPHLPAPWADVPEGSFLVAPDAFRHALEGAGLAVLQWRDVTESAVQWFEALNQRLAEAGPPPLGLHLLMGDAAPTKLGNVGANLKEGRICVVQAVLRKAEGGAQAGT